MTETDYLLMLMFAQTQQDLLPEEDERVFIGSGDEETWN